MNDNQGREGLHSVNASRQIFGLSPLTGDEPELDIPGWLKFVCIACAAACAAIRYGYLDSLFPRL